MTHHTSYTNTGQGITGQNTEVTGVTGQVTGVTSNNQVGPAIHQTVSMEHDT